MASHMPSTPRPCGQSSPRRRFVSEARVKWGIASSLKHPAIREPAASADRSIHGGDGALLHCLPAMSAKRPSANRNSQAFSHVLNEAFADDDVVLLCSSSLDLSQEAECTLPFASFLARADRSVTGDGARLLCALRLLGQGGPPPVSIRHPLSQEWILALVASASRDVAGEDVTLQSCPPSRPRGPAPVSIRHPCRKR